MNRYILMGGEQYYARGGFHDFLSDHESVRCAEETGTMLINEERRMEWFHVVDSETWKIVSGTKTQGLGAWEAVEDSPESYTF
tara:strand:+ start:60 stop:308 length:249 start_codon:yes stop_codon:yes gene_type:complete